MRRLNEILLVLPVLLLVGGKAGAQQQNVQLTKCTADPVLIVANTDFPVLFTATTVNGPATVEVQRLKADGSVDATLGKLLDDGMAPDQKKDDGIYTGRLNVRVPAGPAPLRIAATAKGVTVTCNLEAAVIAMEVNSLLSTLQSTHNAASGSRPTAGNFVTVNRDVAFVPPAADLMVAVQGAGDITVKAIDIKPADQAKNVSWVIQRNPADTVAANTPTCPCNAGAEVTVTPDTAGNFRLVAFVDSNKNGRFDDGEQLRVLRMAFVRYTLQAGHSISTAVAFMGFDDRVTTAGAMSIRAEFLLEGGGANRLIGVGSVTMGVTGNLLADTFTVDYPVPAAPAPPQAPPDNRAGNAREDPGGATPMVDTSRVNSGQEPLGTNQPFRSTSADALVGAGPGGNGQIRRVTGRDGPAVGWNPIHITTTNRFNSTAGNNGFREFVVAFSNTFPRNYFALARGDWTITYAGNRNGLGRWANTASGVAIPGAVGGAAALTAVNQTGDTANAQVRGLSFVNEFKMIYNP